MRNGATDVIARIGGPESYSDKAARKLFAKSVKILVCESIRMCFVSVLEGKATGALVPVNNVIVGDVKEDGKTVKDLANEMGLSRTKTHRLRIRLVLASFGRLEEVRVVYSKQPALDQCKKFSKAHKGITMTDTFNDKKISDTSAAVKLVKDLGLLYTAAVCDADAAKHHGVPVILDPVADKAENFTTFFLYEKKLPKKSKKSAAGKRKFP